MRPYLSLDVFVVVPNHMHGIIAIVGEGKRTDQLAATVESVNRKSGKLQAGSLGAIIGRFKGSVTRRVHELSICRDFPIWQRNYYDHIIRNEKSLQTIREYIMLNPARWLDDRYYVDGGADPLRR